MQRGNAFYRSRGGLSLWRPLPQDTPDLVRKCRPAGSWGLVPDEQWKHPYWHIGDEIAKRLQALAVAHDPRVNQQNPRMLPAIGACRLNVRDLDSEIELLSDLDSVVSQRHLLLGSIRAPAFATTVASGAVTSRR